MNEVPVRVICRCKGGTQCDPCMQRAFEALHAKCTSQPEYQASDTIIGDDGQEYTLEAPRKTGREGYQQGAKKQAPTSEGEETNWRAISDRLSKFLDPEKVDDNIRALADKLDNPV